MQGDFSSFGFLSVSVSSYLPAVAALCLSSFEEALLPATEHLRVRDEGCYVYACQCNTSAIVKLLKTHLCSAVSHCKLHL